MPYGMSKFAEEMVAVQLGRRYGIPTVAMRYSIVQGPRQSVYNAYGVPARRSTITSYIAPDTHLTIFASSLGAIA